MTIDTDSEHINLTDAEKEAAADELIKPFPNVYTTKQLQRKAREMQTRLESRAVITDYVSEEFTESDNVLVESFLGDIKDAKNRKNISDQDYEMICMRAQKMTFTEISNAMGLPVSTCHERLKRAQAKILELKSFGVWECMLDMQKYLKSNWYRVFKGWM